MVFEVDGICIVQMVYIGKKYESRKSEFQFLFPSHIGDPLAIGFQRIIF